MNYIVLDLEWNQPRYAGETLEKPVHLVGEIVQIGAVRLNERFAVKGKLRLAVKPKYYQKIHRKVAKITGLGNEDIRKGLSFPEAFRKLAKFCGNNFVFLTWGPDDVPMLRDNLVLHALDEEWLPDWYDLQVLFSHQKIGTVRQMALEDAIAFLGEKPYQAHDALCDAESTALICRHLDMKTGFREYPYLVGDIIRRPLESRDLPMAFAGKGEALAELSDTPVSCPFCEDYILPESLIPQNANKYLAPGKCSCGKDVLIRFRLYHGQRGKIFAVREIFLQDPILEQFYQTKKERYEKIKKAAREKERQKRARRRKQKEQLRENAPQEEKILA